MAILTFSCSTFVQEPETDAQTSESSAEDSSTMKMTFPQSLLREVLNIAIENDYSCVLKITIKKSTEVIAEKEWDIVLGTEKNNTFSFESLPGGVELSVDVSILLDGEVYYKSNTATVTPHIR